MRLKCGRELSGVLAHVPPLRPADRLGRKGPQLVASRRRTRASASTSVTASSRATGWRRPALRERLRLRASACNGDGNRFHCSAKEPRQECGTRSPLHQRTSLPPMSFFLPFSHRSFTRKCRSAHRSPPPRAWSRPRRGRQRTNHGCCHGRSRSSVQGEKPTRWRPLMTRERPWTWRCQTISSRRKG